MADATVYIVDDDPAIRDSLSFLFSSVNLTAQAYSEAAEFLAAWSPGLRGCVIVDVRMPNMSGVDLFEELRKKSSDLPVVFLTGHGDIHLAVRAMKDGAFDFIEKPFNQQDLLEIVQKAIRADAEARTIHEQRVEIEHRISALTAREREVLDRVVKGESNRGMATALGLSEKTIEFHRAKMMEKMRAGSLAELIMMITTMGRPASMR
jgi:two-component system, LuxR family, response regulator FixJ